MTNPDAPRRGDSPSQESSDWDVERRIAKRIGIRIREARRAQRLTLEQAAEISDVTVSDLAKIERGDVDLDSIRDFRNSRVEAVEAPAMPTSARVLSDAVAIARSAAGVDVDWTREPLTERERAVRQRWLDRQLEDVHGRGGRRLIAADAAAHADILSGQATRCASDFQAAYDEATRIWDEARTQECRAEFLDIADEIDDEIDEKP